MFKGIRRWRKMTWVFLIVNGVMAAWVIAAASSVADTAVTAQDRIDCQEFVDSGVYSSVQGCLDTLEGAADVGGGRGTAILIVFWFMVFVAVSTIWFMTRPREKKVSP